MVERGEMVADRELSVGMGGEEAKRLLSLGGFGGGLGFGAVLGGWGVEDDGAA